MPRRAGSFQNRVAAEELKAAVTEGGTEAPGQILVGMGGVGKTQLAADYARRARETGQVDLLVWVTAATRSAVIEVYAQAAEEVLGRDRSDPEAAAHAFLAWLEPPASSSAGQCRWLVVLDDVADPAAVRGLWPSESPQGRVIVTTRSRAAALTGPGRHLVPVGQYTRAEAVAYLADFFGRRNRTEPPEQIAALAEELGRLPLALSQAAAYLIDADVDCAAYRVRLANRATALTDLLPDTSFLPDDQAATLSAAWSLSIDHADRLRPHGLARPLLHLAAMLDPNGIPSAVLTNEHALGFLASHRKTPEPTPVRTRQDLEVTPLEAVRALRALHVMSLIEHTPSEPHVDVRVHQLIQRAIRDTLEPDERAGLARTAADALIAAWPENELDTALAQTLRANSESLADHAYAALVVPTVHPLLLRTGRSLGESGQVAAAVTFFQRLGEQARRQLGPDHHDTLTIGWELAHWEGEGGHPSAAVTTLAALLGDQLRLLGAEHRDTLNTRHELAGREGQRGRVSHAVTALTALLGDQLRLLGAEHRDTLATRHSLIWWQWEAGDVAGAVPALGALLDDQLRVLGPDHSDVLATRHNLAAAWQANSDIPQARTVAEQLLADRLRINGPDHPDTLSARHNLIAYQAMDGDKLGASRALDDLLMDRLRIQGPDHPDTLTARAVLARLQGETGHEDDAVQACLGLLAARERVLGPEHPDTLDTRNRLAHWQGEAGNAKLAGTTLAGLLTDQLRILGPDNPRTLATRHDLAHWQAEAGDAPGAVTALAALLQDRLRVLGPDHSDTRETCRELRFWQDSASDGDGNTP